MDSSSSKPSLSPKALIALHFRRLAMPRTELSRDELKREREMLYELKKFHRENQHLASPLTTQFTKKRVRVPQVNPETNPFCMERQLAGEYELLNLNKAPK
ncbi:hypothetical protein FI667_g5238, partial [Globisporangium splendens]